MNTNAPTDPKYPQKKGFLKRKTKDDEKYLYTEFITPTRFNVSRFHFLFPPVCLKQHPSFSKPYSLAHRGP